ncbi:MAG: type I secretion C-terminal target domain-containing protein [Leptothrix sp. (in: b-proteobacteria)]
MADSTTRPATATPGASAQTTPTRDAAGLANAASAAALPGLRAVRIEQDYVPARLPEGRVTHIWGDAIVRKPGGDLHALQVGEDIVKGDMILTTQNGIVQIDDSATRLARFPALDPLEQVLLDPPGAGLTDFEGTLDSGLRIERLNEVLTSQTFSSSLVSADSGGPLDVLGASSFNNLAVPTPPAVATGTLDSPRIGEAAGFALFTFTLTSANPNGMTVNLATGGGTATPGVDYGSLGVVASPAAATNGAAAGTLAANAQVSVDGGQTFVSTASVFLPAGQTSVLVRVPIVDDTIHEPDETFSLTATLASPGSPGGTTTVVGTATITDNDPIPTVLTVVPTTGNGSVAEGNASANSVSFTATLSNPSSTATTYQLTVLGSGANPADPASDLSPTITFSDPRITLGADGHTVTVPAGVTVFDITLLTHPDNLVEADEGFTLQLGSASAQGTILNDDNAPLAPANAFTAREDDPLSPMHLAPPTDANGDALTITITSIGLSAGQGALFTATGAPVTAGMVLTPADFAGLQYLAPTNFNGSTTVPTALPAFSYSVSDGANTSTGQVSLNLLANNDAPVISSSPLTSTGTEDLPQVFSVLKGNAISFSDPDLNDTLTAVIHASEGTFSVNAANLAAGLVVSNSGTGTVTLTGLAADINHALDGATFLNAPDRFTVTGTPVQLTVDVHDAGGLSAPQASTAISVNPATDILSLTLQGEQSRPVEVLRSELLGHFSDPTATITKINGVAFDAAHTPIAVTDGVVTLSNGGDLVFTPNASFVSPIVGGVLLPTSFTYTVLAGGREEATFINFQIAANATPDHLTGATGHRDVFAWHLADASTSATPHAFTIDNFDTAKPTVGGGDLLDLRDLLSGESDANLSNYLSFSKVGADTLLQINHLGTNATSATDSPDVKILLTGVDLTLGGTLNSSQVVNQLITDHKLLVDPHNFP